MGGSEMSWNKIKRTGILLLFMFGLFSLSGLAVGFTQETNQIQTFSKDFDVYSETIIRALLKELQQASDDYYDNSYPVFPTVELDTTKLKDISKQQGKTIVEFEIMPFIGPHNTVGIDSVALSLDRGNITVINYQHNEDF